MTNTNRVTCALPIDIYEQLISVSKFNGHTRSTQARQAVNLYLAQHATEVKRQESLNTDR